MFFLYFFFRKSTNSKHEKWQKSFLGSRFKCFQCSTCYKRHNNNNSNNSGCISKIGQDDWMPSSPKHLQWFKTDTIAEDWSLVSEDLVMARNMVTFFLESFSIFTAEIRAKPRKSHQKCLRVSLKTQHASTIYRQLAKMMNWLMAWAWLADWHSCGYDDHNICNTPNNLAKMENNDGRCLDGRPGRWTVGGNSI